MFTQRVREKLAQDYGIKCIPNELLVYLVRKHRAKSDGDQATVAFLVANEWQRGLTTSPTK